MAMDADGGPSGWLLLLTQLPRSASSPRVALWRRLRAAGATTMVTSVWVLPETAPHAELLEQLRDGLLRQGGIGFVLSIPASTPGVNEAIVAGFRADRGREYDEFAEQCAALLEEIGKEGKAGKYTFAELEESEQDLEKLVRWLGEDPGARLLPGRAGAGGGRHASAVPDRGGGLLAVGLRGRGRDWLRCPRDSGAWSARTAANWTRASPCERRTAGRDLTARTPRR